MPFDGVLTCTWVLCSKITTVECPPSKGPHERKRVTCGISSALFFVQTMGYTVHHIYNHPGVDRIRNSSMFFSTHLFLFLIPFPSPIPFLPLPAPFPLSILTLFILVFWSFSSLSSLFSCFCFSLSLSLSVIRSIVVYPWVLFLVASVSCFCMALAASLLYVCSPFLLYLVVFLCY